MGATRTGARMLRARRGRDPRRRSPRTGPHLSSAQTKPRTWSAYQSAGSAAERLDGSIAELDEAIASDAPADASVIYHHRGASKLRRHLLRTVTRITSLLVADF